MEVSQKLLQPTQSNTLQSVELTAYGISQSFILTPLFDSSPFRCNFKYFKTASSVWPFNAFQQSTTKK